MSFNLILSYLKNPQVLGSIIIFILSLFSFYLYQENQNLTEELRNISTEYNKSLIIINNLEEDNLELNKEMASLNEDLNNEKEENQNLNNKIIELNKTIEYLENTPTINYLNFFNINVIYVMISLLIISIPFTLNLFDFKLVEINIKNKQIEWVVLLYKVFSFLILILSLFYLIWRFSI